MPSQYLLFAIVGGAVLVVLIGVLAMVAKFWRQVDQGTALIVNTMGTEPFVTFTGKVVYPVVYRAETMDISVKTIEIDRRGKEGLICRDNIRADIKVTFFVRVNKESGDVLKVAQAIGCQRASDPRVIAELFNAKFSEALKTVGKQMNFEDLYTKRQQFKDEIINVIGPDLNGFKLDDCAIDYLEQTPIESLDKDNIMDAEGIRKITDLTVIQNVKTNELRQKERMEIGSQNLASDEAIFRFDQRRAEAEAKKAREIAVAQAREENEARRIAEEEHKKTLLMRHKNEEESMVANEAKERSVLVARQAKEREVAIEIERVKKAQQLEMLSREREVEIQRINKDKEVEAKKKEIADIIRTRVAVDKTVAEEEERIKDVRTIAEANRNREAVKIAAEAQAAESLVLTVKAAEAAAEAAKHKGREQLAIAEADLESADKTARAKIRLAEGVQAEAAAEGLAKVRVKEAEAQAIEKTGMVEARVTLEKLQAAALGEEKQGLAKVKVAEAEAVAIEKKGLAEALVIKERLGAEASGEEQLGLAKVRVAEADAVAIQKKGTAEAEASRQRFSAEAAGIQEKATAMKNLDPESRDHEEFRIRLQANKDVALHTLETRKSIAEQQSGILAKAFEHAKIQIVGGDGQFFDRFIKAVSLGQSFDTTLEQSDTLKAVLGDYVNGKKSFATDIKDLLAGTDPEAAKNLTVSSLLAKLATGADDDARQKIAKLAARAKDLGIDDLGAR
ncbi:MAG: hypothetical protein HOW73_12655 [Polyangiaceae bacterium]|nr:hypothetical protein [Polyangiaceae bacterium]